ncbi:hypothetical protein SAMN02799626_00114 [Caulobacter sp. UNC279MFTsu5.1]|nr:hypothetical protein SAMN02799626_00114 [Caulobacter sp. UNC279MFTsu5.1]
MVPKPEIPAVIRLVDGEVLSARELVESLTHEDAVKWRMELRESLREGAPQLICDQCPTPVYLVCNHLKAFFFRHTREDGSCPAVTRSTLTAEEIRARQYQGLRESPAHQRLKGLIADSLAADPAFEAVAIEKTWRGEVGRRRPDVSARLAGLGLAFEGQLSTTFLSVVAARRVFYREVGGLLVWILATFDPDSRRMTEDDIVFPNNSNVLVIDDDTAAASRSQGRFVVDCWYRQPRSGGVGQADAWDRKRVPFTDLVLDTAGQRAFLVDVEGLEAAARDAAKARLAAATESRRLALREDLLTYLDLEEGGGGPEERTAIWTGFALRLAEFGVPFPSSPWRRSNLQRWLRVVRTALGGEVSGWNFSSLVQVAHHLYDQHPDLLLVFGQLLRQSGHIETLRSQDRSRKWQDRAAGLKRLDDEALSKYRADEIELETIRFLFPETAATLGAMRRLAAA